MTLWIVGMIALRLLILAIVILGIYKLVSHFRQKERERRAVETRAGSRGVVVLRERFASGEIDESEYKHKLEVLESR